MRVMALDDDGRRLDAGLIPIGLLDQLDVELSPFRPAHVHAQQHPRPVAALRAARPGMDFDIGVVGVGLARKQRFELAPFAFGFQGLEGSDSLGFGRRVALGFAELDQRRRIVEIALDLRQRTQPVFQHGALAHHLFGGFRGRSRGSDLRISRSVRQDVALAASTSKMPPQQPDGLLDRFGQLFGFGAHDPTNEYRSAMSPLKTALGGARLAATEGAPRRPIGRYQGPARLGKTGAPQ